MNDRNTWLWYGDVIASDKWTWNGLCDYKGWWTCFKLHVWQDESDMNYVVDKRDEMIWFIWCKREMNEHDMSTWLKNEHDMHYMIKRKVYIIWCIRLTIRWIW